MSHSEFRCGKDKGTEPNSGPHLLSRGNKFANLVFDVKLCKFDLKKFCLLPPPVPPTALPHAAPPPHPMHLEGMGVS